MEDDRGVLAEGKEWKRREEQRSSRREWLAALDTKPGVRVGIEAPLVAWAPARNDLASPALLLLATKRCAVRGSDTMAIRAAEICQRLELWPGSTGRGAACWHHS